MFKNSPVFYDRSKTVILLWINFEKNVHTSLKQFLLKTVSDFLFTLPFMLW